MDLRSLEDEVQRLIGYEWLVSGGMAERGPFLTLNSRRRLMKIWLPREGAQAARVADMVRELLATAGSPAYQETVYQAQP